MRRVHVIGRKNSGKTTLVAELVRALTSRGYSVGTVKHTHHRHELDTPGKDSHQHRLAGATAVGILSPDVSAVFWPTGDRGESARYEEMAPIFSRCDLVLVEGHSSTSAPRIEVWRSATGASPLAEGDLKIEAVVTDDPVSVEIQVWPRADIGRLADQVLLLAGVEPKLA